MGEVHCRTSSASVPPETQAKVFKGRNICRTIRFQNKNSVKRSGDGFLIHG